MPVISSADRATSRPRAIQLFSGDQQRGQGDFQAPGNPAVQNDLAEVLGVFARVVLVALADGGLVRGGQEHGVDDTQAQGHNLVAEDVGQGIGRGALGHRHLQE